MPLRTSIEIPIRGKDEVVEVTLDELPPEASEIVLILKQEQAPLKLWHEFAIAYYERGNRDACRDVLIEAALPEVLHKFPGTKTGRVGLLVSLASYYVNLAACERNAQLKQEHLLQATARFNEADGIDVEQPLTWLGKGVFLLVRNELDRAVYQFNKILSTSPDFIPAMLGVAAVSFNNKEYAKALELYRKCLLRMESPPPEVRLGIALCLHQLGAAEPAEQAYQRVLQLSPKNVEALTGWAILEMNKTPQNLPKALELLKRAYDVDDGCPPVLNLLASHFFFRSEYAKVEALARRAYHNTEVAAMRSDSCLILGRMYHAQADYESAFQHYFQATKLNPDSLQAQFGLGQMHIHRGDVGAATGCFDKVLAKEPENYEALKIMGSIFSKSSDANRRAKALAFLKKATAAMPDDIEALLELAELQQQMDPKEALAVYAGVISQWKETIEAPLPSEILNNYGVLKQRHGEAAEGRELLHQALKQIEEEMAAEVLPEAEKDGLKGLSITVRYNIARLTENDNRDAEAQEMYQALINEFPSYIDSYLRMGAIAQRRGHHSDASHWYKEVLNVDADNATAWSLLATQQMMRNELKPAKKTMERILARHNGDAYALVALGNIYHREAKLETKKDAVEHSYSRALHHYYTSLNLNLHNAYAANGIAVILAEKGHFREAKDIFLQLREALPVAPDIWLNLAHVEMEQESYVKAIRLYESCLQKLHNENDVPLLIYIARAYFVMGRAETSLEHMHRCLSILARALHLRAYDNSIRFNVALAQQECAVITLRKSEGDRTVAQVRAAQKLIETAAVMFRYLHATPPFPRNSYEPSMAQERARYCESTMRPNALMHLQRQEASEARREQLASELEQQRVQQAQAEQELKDKMTSERRAAEEEIERHRRAVDERVQQSLQRAAAAAADAAAAAASEDKTARKKRGRRSEATGSDDEQAPRRSRKKKSDDGEGDDAGKKRRRRRRRSEKKEGEEENAEDDGASAAAKDAEGSSSSGGESSGDEGGDDSKAKAFKKLAAARRRSGGAETSTPGRRRVVMDDVIDSDESGSDQEGEGNDDSRMSVSPAPAKDASPETDA